MKTFGLIVVVLAMVFAMSSVVAAQVASEPAAQGKGENKGPMARYDKNGDGLIEKDEWPGRPEVFDRLDKNGDGKLDTVEFAEARQELKEMRDRWQERRAEAGAGGEGPAEGADRDRMRERIYGAAMFASALFRLIDADNDGKITDAELQNFVAKIKDADIDKDGNITKEEAREFVKKCLAQRIGEAFMKKYDANGDGKVTRDEFKGGNRRFDMLDPDKDGVITIQDFEKRAPQFLEERRGRNPREEGRGEGRDRGEGRWREKNGPRPEKESQPEPERAKDAPVPKESE